MTAHNTDIVVGLDIGTTKICVVVGEYDGEQVKIIGTGVAPSTGMRRGMINNIEMTSRSIVKALEEAERMAGIEIRSVYVGIAGGHIESTDSTGTIAIKGSEICQKDIDRVIDIAKTTAPVDKEVIHILPQEFVVDNQNGIHQPLGMSGNRLEVKAHIVTGAVNSAKDIIRACHRAGLDVADIVLESLASSQSVLADEERELGVALVDIGGGTTDVALFVENSIKDTAIIGVGGQNLTNDISFGLRTPMVKAEELKVKYGCALAELVNSEDMIEIPSVGGRKNRSLSRHTLAEICEPRIEEILVLVDQELLKSGYKRLLGGGVVLTGGSSLIEGITELGEQIFDLPVRVGAPDRIIGLVDQVNSPIYATGVGLLQFGCEQAQQGRATNFGIRADGIFAGILERMRKWFNDIA